MRAVGILSDGGLALGEVGVPAVGSEEVLVRVRAAGVNRADLLQRRGRYAAPAGVRSDIPGLEYAGEVAALGEGVVGRAVGDRVMGLVGGAAYAEYVVVHAEETIGIPAGLTWEAAAAIPEAFITAHDALFTQSDLSEGETVLIHAAGSGVGTAAVQLAAAKGARVIGTARSAEKLARAHDLGMHIGIEAVDGAFADEVIRQCGADAVNVVLELVGGDYVRGDIAVLALHGRLSLVGLMAGTATELDLSAVLRKRLTIRGTVMRSRTLPEKIAAARAFEAHVVPLLGQGTVKPVIDRVFDLADANAAHDYIESNANFGKVVLHVA